MEQLVLQTILVLQFFYFAFIRNRLDFMLVFYLANILYHWQIIYGWINLGKYQFDVNVESYVILIVVFVVLQVVTMLHDVFSSHRTISHVDMERCSERHNIAIILVSISCIASVLDLMQAGGNIFLGKAAFHQASVTYTMLSFFPAAMVFIYASIYRHWVLLIASLVPLLLYLFVGFRATVVVAIIASFVAYNFNMKLISFKGLRNFLLMVLIFSFFVVYKFSYIDLKSGSLESLQKFQDVNYIKYTFFSTEWGQISSNLVLTSSQDLTEHYSFSNALIGSLTGVNRILAVDMKSRRFSNTIEQHANPGFSYGLGGTFWGEMFQAGGGKSFQLGGYVSVLLGALFVLFILAYLNYKHGYNPARYVYWLYFTTFLAFYLPRTDFTLAVGNFKNIIFLIVLAYIVLILLKGKISIPKIFQPYRTNKQ